MLLIDNHRKFLSTIMTSPLSAISGYPKSERLTNIDRERLPIFPDDLGIKILAKNPVLTDYLKTVFLLII